MSCSTVVHRVRLVPLLVATTILGLVFSAFPGNVVPATAAAPAEPPVVPVAEPWVQPSGAGVARPDLVSARVTARASGQRVEVLSARTESQRTWVLPSGLIEAELAGGPVCFKDPAAVDTAGWRDIDVKLKRNPDGSVAPTAM